MSPFLWGLLAGAIIGGSLTFVLSCILIAGREDRFWKSMGLNK